jgi:hypothetical protein
MKYTAYRCCALFLREAKGLVNCLDVFSCSPWLYAWTERTCADGETQES